MSREPEAPRTGGRSLRAYRLSHALMTRTYAAMLALHSLARAVLAGIWLGLLDREQLLAIADEFYATHDRYADDAYNLSGLWAWERAIVDRHFAGRSHLLVVGAGAGREVIALARSGHRVRAYECNRDLVADANGYLVDLDLPDRVRYAPPDTCPADGESYDGLVVGWGAYMLVAGRERRIALLRSMRDQVGEGTPLLLSFFVRPPDARRFAVIRTIGNALRRARRRELLDLGDDLEPEYVHYFRREELEGELVAAGFEMREFAEDPYGHAVAVAA